MAKSKLKISPGASPMTRRPRFVQAIGMISIEHASLESILGDLLGALLGIHLEIGHTLYFTPKATIARLDLLLNVVELSIGGNAKLSRKVISLVKRSRVVMGKRHEMIHSLWAVTDAGHVARLEFPKWKNDEVKIQQLNSIIADYRALIDELPDLIEDVQLYRGLAWQVPWKPYGKNQIHP